MLDIQVIRDRPGEVEAAARRKRLEAPVSRLLEVDRRRRDLTVEIDGIRADKNRFSREVRELQGAEKDRAIAAMKAAGAREKDLDRDLQEVEEEYRALMLRMPNLLDEEVLFCPRHSAMPFRFRQSTSSCRARVKFCRNVLSFMPSDSASSTSS